MQHTQARVILSTSYYVFFTLVIMESLRMINSVGAYGVLEAMANDLGIGIDRAQMVMIAPFLFGLVLGQLFSGMLSDRFGRMTLFILFLNIYAIASLLCFIFKDKTFFMWFRLMTGFTGAISELTVRAILADYCDLKLSARLFSRICGLSAIIIGLSPLLMNHLSQLLGWRSFFVFNAIVCCTVSALALYLVKTFDNKINKQALTGRYLLCNFNYTLVSGTYLMLCGFFVLSAIIMQFSFALLPMMVINYFKLSSTTLSLIVGILSGLVFWASAQTNSWLVTRYSMLSIIRLAFIITWVCSVLHPALFILNDDYLKLVLFLADFFIGIFAENIIFINLFMLATQSADKRVGNGFVTSLTIALFTLGMVFSSTLGAFVGIKQVSIAYALYALFVTLCLALYLVAIPNLRERLGM
tara:strand:- start:4299 stop:5537 length:1239 start_codon:yes stop_codon:yes gene_type:complete